MLRRLVTSNLEQLAQFQPNKNRRYTQLQSGQLSTHYLEARVHQVQLLREQLDVGARIEAAPASDFIPFAYLLPNSGDYRFCGYQSIKNGLIQAGGGTWDIRFQHRLDYVAAVFNRDYFCQGYEILTGRGVPNHLLQSRLAQTNLIDGHAFANSVMLLLYILTKVPKHLHCEKINPMLCGEILKLTVLALRPAHSEQKLEHPAKRTQGVMKAVEYIHAHGAELPDIQTLCQIARLSERSLQYGFQDLLGMTPVKYLRMVRLNGARQQLQYTSKGERSVSDVALEWGFLELGRFSRDYKQLFLELPSATLANHY